MRMHRHKALDSIYGHRRGNQGAVLLGLIITIVFLSALGAAMVSQTSTQEFLLAGGHLADQAFYLAESGYRYAAAKLKSGADIDALSAHGSYDLGQDQSFSIDILAYVFEITGGGGTSTLEARVPFGSRPALSDTGGVLFIEGVPLQSYDSVDVTDPDPSVVRFVKSTGNWAGWAGQRVAPVVQSAGYTGTGAGGSLSVSGSLAIFPPRNGRFVAGGKVYRYHHKDESSSRLVGVAVDSGTVWSDPPSTGNVVLRPFLELKVTGTAGTGSLQTHRTLVYSVPLEGSDRSEFFDSFDDRSHWEATSRLGSHAIQDIGGDKALRVTGTDIPSGLQPVQALIALDSATTPVDLGKAASAAGRFLSYDAQVKVGFVSTPSPDYGFDPLPIPRYFVAGLSARLDNNSNFYGVSFLRGSNVTAPLPDNIHNTIVPVDQRPLIVLWQQTNFGNDRVWLAYKELTPVIFFSDDMEAGDSNWTADSPWGRVTYQSHSPVTSWHDSPGGDYQNNVNVSLTSLPVDLSWERDVELVFWHRYNIEAGFDYGHVEISKDGFTSSVPLAQFTNGFAFFFEQPQSSWVEVRLPIPADYLTDGVQVRFRLETDFSVRREGWYIDDVELKSPYYPVNEAALMLRLREAATVAFVDGNGEPIRAGDLVTQDSSSAYGTVLGEPILSSGTWGTDAAGIVLLNRLSPFYTFEAGDLKVNGVVRARAVAGGFRPKDNYIRVYYGDRNGYGTPNTTPFDMERRAYPRCTAGCAGVNWPPDEVDQTIPENDYYSILQWDVINSSVATLSPVPSVNEPGAIVRSNEPELLSPVSGFFAQPELGLHALGKGATNVFYDDFGLRTNSPTITGFAPAVQY